MTSGPKRRFQENATSVASLLVTGLWLALLLSGVGGSLWLAVLIVGYVVIVPMIALLYGDEDDVREWWDDDEIDPESIDGDGAQTSEPRDARDARDALETLRDRYAAGELTDEQFERKLDRLLETETVEDADQWRRTARAERDRERASDDDRDRNPEYE